MHVLWCVRLELQYCLACWVSSAAGDARGIDVDSLYARFLENRRSDHAVALFPSLTVNNATLTHLHA